jgi:tetratricopeptide (TPR) repeat protein
MAVKSKKKKESHSSNELLENPEALAQQISKTEEFFIQHKTKVIVAVAVVAVAIAGIFGYRYYESYQNTEAQNEMFQAIYYFEQDSLSQALRGDGANLGLIQIEQEYTGTDAANLAKFYIGASYLKLGEYSSALLYLEEFSADDLLIQGQAYNLMGDAHMELEQYSEAAAQYVKAANYKPTDAISPSYLMKAGLAYEQAGDNEQAASAYQRVVDEYPTSDLVPQANKYLHMITGA